MKRNIARLRKSTWIKDLKDNGASDTGKFVLLRYRKSESNSVHMAVVVSSKVGSAVVRNKIKRQLREILRIKGLEILVPGYFLFIAKRSIINARFDQLQRDILELITRIVSKP